MELPGTMPQSVYKKSLFIVCCGFVLKHTISAMLSSPSSLGKDGWSLHVEAVYLLPSKGKQEGYHANSWPTA